MLWTRLNATTAAHISLSLFLTDADLVTRSCRATGPFTDKWEYRSQLLLLMLAFSLIGLQIDHERIQPIMLWADKPPISIRGRRPKPEAQRADSGGGVPGEEQPREEQRPQRDPGQSPGC